MKVNYNSYNLIYTYSKKTLGTQISFGSAKTRKLINEIKTSKNLKNINVTFDDIVSVYEELGYDVVMKRGSHAVVPLTNTVNLPIVIPHGSCKYVHVLDLKRLQYVLNGDINKALNVH